MYYVSISIVMVSWMPIWRDVTRYILYSPPFFQENPPRYSFQNFFLLSIHLSPTSFCRIQLEWFVWRYCSRIRFFLRCLPLNLPAGIILYFETPDNSAFWDYRWTWQRPKQCENIDQHIHTITPFCTDRVFTQKQKSFLFYFFL